MKQKYYLKKLNPDGSVDKIIEHAGVRCEVIDYACELNEKFGTNYIVVEVTETETFDTRLLKTKVEI